MMKTQIYLFLDLLLLLLPVVSCLDHHQQQVCYNNNDDSGATSSSLNDTTTKTIPTTILTSVINNNNNIKYPCNADVNPYGAYHSSCPDRTCPREIYNSKLHASNVIEIDLDPTIISKIRKAYEEDVEPNLGYSTDDICYVDPYHPDKQVWAGHAEKVYRSNAKWYSMRSYNAYQKYAKFVEELGVKEDFGSIWMIS